MFKRLQKGGNHMLHKLIIGIIFLVLSLLVQPASAVEKQGTKTDEKASAKCWQRQKAYTVSGNAPVCVAFEKLLNTTCESPEKLKCNWTLPDGEKRFKKLRWKTIDWREYWSLIGDISVSLIFPTGEREGRWELMKDRERKAFDEGKSSLSITIVDIDNDGNKEQVVRMDFVPCNENAASVFGVMNPDKRIDSFRGLFFSVNTDLSPEIMYYNGKAFMFSLSARNVMIYEGFPPGEMMYSSQNVCKIRYIKGEKKQ
jgi:hypothetical protein